MSDARVTTWYEMYGTELFGFIRTLMRGHPDAEDIHATVFLEAVQHADMLDDTPRGWFYQTARWRVIDWQRKQQRYPAMSLDERFGALSPSPEEYILDRVVGQAVWKTTQRMTQTQRFSFWHVYAQDRSIAEVAEWMDLSPGAVKALLHRAKVHLLQNPILTSALG
jgi:RNA polymerase sigma-70 factor (ECF subfamily)